ncbi:MAG: glycine cleavage system protein H [Candidatus Krumholzibacteria bacterium]|nr:glycine cleavage system protein H [Candidatus Krumholzibacteria bacterium]
MEEFKYLDIFATKGLEYLLVIGFLAVFVVLWRMLQATPSSVPARVQPPKGSRPRADWFKLDEVLHYHPGHAWALPEDGPLVKVGIDDFAQKLLGEAERIDLPAVGEHVEQGGKGWRLRVNSRFVDMLSPVGGKVVEVNHEVLESPRLITDDPYGRGWLLKIRVPNVKTALKNLLTGTVAKAWMDDTVRVLSQRDVGQLGVVMQDGGRPVSGFALQLAPDRWEEVAAEFLLSR